jgi:light-regulated signal transduction histidine kinase (bacteriophytochrome)
MTTIVHSVLNDLHHERQSREVEVRIGELPRTEGDPALLRQALANLLSNAYKFTRRQERPIIEVGAQTKADGMPTYFARDNGAGFDLARAQRLLACSSDCIAATSSKAPAWACRSCSASSTATVGASGLRRQWDAVRRSISR